MACKIIAEIGTNFDPQSPLAAISEAKEAGADIIKLQLFRADRLYALPELQARLKPWEFPLALLPEARACAGVLWASVFDIDLLEEAAPHLDGIKIASGDFVYTKLIYHAALYTKRFKIPLILATGAATEEEIASILHFVRPICHELIVLHCVSAYPARWQDYHLRFLRELANKYRVANFGLSDHTTDETAALIALALGASYFEHHFRPSKVPGDQLPPDWGAWAFPAERFRRYVEQLRMADIALGDGRKVVAPCEEQERVMARRSSHDYLRPNDPFRRQKRQEGD